MVAVAPFRGLRFDLPSSAPSTSRSPAPPYDVISPEAHAAYEAMSPYNVVRPDPGPAGPEDIPQPSATAAATTGTRPICSPGGGPRASCTRRAPCLYVYEEIYELGGPSGSSGGPGQRRPRRHRAMGRAPRADHGGAGRRPAPAAGGDRGQPLPRLRRVRRGRRGRRRARRRHRRRAALDCADEAGVRHRLWVVDDPAGSRPGASAWPPSAC